MTRRPDGSALRSRWSRSAQEAPISTKRRATPVASKADAPGFAPVPTIDRRSSGELVAIHIRALIFDGRLRQGDRVRQDEIAEELGVSRIPVREAIIALDREGWVTITPHRGAFVHGLDEDSVRDHYELLGLVYGLVAKHATERATEELFGRLRDSQEALQAASSPAEMHDANDVFLRALLEMARAPRLASVLRGMSTVVPGNFFELVPGAIEVQRKGTAVIAAAIASRDPEAAACGSAELMRAQGALVVALLASRGMFAGDDA